MLWDQAGLLQRWELDATESLFAPAREEALPPRLRAFRAVVRERLGGGVRHERLLRDQLGEAWLPEGDRKNVRLVAEGAGRTRALSVLEAALLERQLGRGDMLADPTEFLAVVLRKAGRARVYSYTTDVAGVRGLGRLHEWIERDVAEGWTLELNVHNHNFFFAGKAVLGGTAPSRADVWVWRVEGRDYGLKTAAITNGFDTTEFQLSEIGEFEALGPR